MAQLLVESRRLVRIREGLYFHAEPLQVAVDRVVAFLRENQAITPQQIKDLLGISRKYAIPLLEWLDTQRLTVRVGDKRVLREGAPSPRLRARRSLPARRGSRGLTARRNGVLY